MWTKRKISGGILAVIGFMLSPLSWWNDLFVNVPLATAFAWGVAAFCEPAFETALVVGYWLTNVLGLVLMHKGAAMAASQAEAKPFSPRNLVKDVVVSLLYTLLLLGLIKLGVLQPFADYWRSK